MNLPDPKKHEAFQEFVEKERTRSLLIEAAKGGTVTDYWRQFLIVTLFFAAIGGVFLSRTQRFRAVLEAINKDPIAEKRKALQPKVTSNPSTNEPGAASASANPGINPDDNAELENLQKSREAMGHKLEALGEARGPMPTPAAVAAAMNGQNAPTPASASRSLEAAGLPASDRAPSSKTQEIGIAGGEKESAPIPELLVTNPGQPVYREMKQIPPQYARERAEFSDTP